METIRNYLENMFANMPRTPEVARAKAELLQMMEDKYNELIAEGKTQNEAVGTVISEFGNLEELAEALGLEEEVQQERQQNEASPRRLLIMDEAKDFIRFCGIRAAGIALGVALCILSVNGPIFFEHFEIIGIFLMFLAIAAAVGLFVIMGVYGKQWQYIKREACSIDYATANWVANEKARYRNSYTSQLVIGILLCSCSWFPFILLGNIFSGGWWDNFMAVIFFAIVAVGVFLIVHTNLVMGGYNTLLKLNDMETVSGSFTKESFPEYSSPIADRIMSVYWPTVRSVYLIWSFITFQWWKTWIIWPMAAIVHAILKSFTVKKGGN
ncbi:MAG: hypothetical protein IK115_09655 [Lachnospiraceae bacterium]|nr:hypothetical protein [Lachnospiraceae bacterium]